MTQRGYYPDAIDKANQDALAVKKDVAGDPDTMFFGVFDGHGTAGTECAKFARDKVSSASVYARARACMVCMQREQEGCSGRKGFRV